MLKYIIQQAKLFYSSSPKIRRLVKRISSSKLYYKITRSKIDRQRREDLKGPFNLVIETSNFCNARCVMCPYSVMKRPKKIMDKEIFDKIVARINEEKLPLNKVFFSGLGEPLTDSRLVSRIKALKELNFPVKLYTNASLLTPEISQQLVNLGLDEMNISFNGVTPKQYQQVMGLDFDRVVGNIEALLRIKGEEQSRWPLIQISSIITRENENDIQKHIRNWSGKVDSVTVSLAHEWGGAVEIKSKINPPLADQNSKLTYPCRSLWHTFVIDSSGNFVICCRDFESQYVLGNIRTHSFAEIQNKPLLKDFHRLHLKFTQRELPEMCQRCNFPYQDGVEWYLPRSID